MISLHDICCCCVFLRCPFGVLGLHTASRFLVLVFLGWLSFGFVEYHPQPSPRRRCIYSRQEFWAWEMENGSRKQSNGEDRSRVLGKDLSIPLGGHQNSLDGSPLLARGALSSALKSGNPASARRTSIPGSRSSVLARHSSGGSPHSSGGF
jgi:hypothetical protein